MDSDTVVQLDVWSDYVCPFCYLELPVLERLADEFGDRLVIRWRAFELRPEPVPTLDPGGEYLRTTWARAVYPMAEASGITLRLPPVQPRSRRALEAAEFARTRGRFDAMHLALFRAFFEEGRDIGQVAVLAEIAAGIGLDADALSAALEAGTHTGRVLEDEALAARLGVSAVPGTLVRPGGTALEGAELISGALPLERMRRVVEGTLAGARR